MPTTPNAMQGMVAVNEDFKGKRLGWLVWFSIPDEAVGLKKLKMSLASHGLPLSLAPKDTKAIHVFKRAMREMEGRFRVGDILTETTVALVQETPDDCVYQISRLKRDIEERIVEYPKAMRVIFNKHTEDINFNPLGEVSRSDVMGMMERITDFYEKNGSKITGARVRTTVRNYLKDEPDEQRNKEGLSGENLRGKAGGIYFIPDRYTDQVRALSEMLSEVYPGKAYLHAVPMADSRTARELVAQHHLANTRQEMKEAMADIKGMLSGDRERSVRSDVVAHHWARYRALERRAAKYQEMLGDEQEEIADMARILHKQLDKLTGV